MVVRQVVSIVVLPVTVTVLIPLWIRDSYGVPVALPQTPAEAALALLGAGVVLVGLVVVAACIRHFAVEGRGTLAPWDPPKLLVVAGPYRFVRNPMISGVVLVLAGEALALRSIPHTVWAGMFAVANMVYIPLLEEPRLEERFGAAYREYCRRVPRFIPRLRITNDAS
jgi:protein-S-isoprenylcysteine O-methyltransferase Ste14